MYHGSLIRILERCFKVSRSAAERAVELGLHELLLHHLDPQNCPGCPTEKCLRAFIQWPAANAAIWDTVDFPCRAALVTEDDENSYGAKLEGYARLVMQTAQLGTAQLIYRLFGPTEGAMPGPLRVIEQAKQLVKESEAAAQRYEETSGRADATASEVRRSPLALKRDVSCSFGSSVFRMVRL